MLPAIRHISDNLFFQGIAIYLLQRPDVGKPTKIVDRIAKGHRRVKALLAPNTPIRL